MVNSLSSAKETTVNHLTTTSDVMLASSGPTNNNNGASSGSSEAVEAASIKPEVKMELVDDLFGPYHMSCWDEPLPNNGPTANFPPLIMSPTSSTSKCTTVKVPTESDFDPTSAAFASLAGSISEHSPLRVLIPSPHDPDTTTTNSPAGGNNPPQLSNGGSKTPAPPTTPSSVASSTASSSGKKTVFTAKGRQTLIVIFKMNGFKFYIRGSSVAPSSEMCSFTPSVWNNF